MIRIPQNRNIRGAGKNKDLRGGRLMLKRVQKKKSRLMHRLTKKLCITEN